MTLGLDPCFSQMVPKLKIPGVVWELVVKMLQPNRSNRHSEHTDLAPDLYLHFSKMMPELEIPSRV